MATDTSRTASFEARNRAQLRAVPRTDRSARTPATGRRLTAARPRPVGVPTVASAARTRRGAPGAVAVDDAVTTALESLDVIEGYAQEVADAFRWDQVQEACRCFVDLIKSTRMVLELAGATASASGDTLQAAFDAGESRADEEMHEVVNRLIECHMEEDWAALADTLDHDFVEAVALWRRVFENLRQVGRTPPPPGDAA
jgi:hypothetical protein